MFFFLLTFPVIVCVIQTITGCYRCTWCDSLSVTGRCLGTWPGKEGTWTPSITTPLSVVPFDTAESPRPSGLAPLSSCGQRGETMTHSTCLYFYIWTCVSVSRTWRCHGDTCLLTLILRAMMIQSKNKKKKSIVFWRLISEIFIFTFVFQFFFFFFLQNQFKNV